MQADALPSVVPGLAEEIFKSISATQQITEEHLSSLRCLYDKHLLKALRIVDQGGVFCFIGEHTGRRVIQVKGQGSECYNVFNEFCTCQGFFFDVLNKQEASCCKHQLATRIAQALGKVRENTVNDLVIAELLQEGG